MSACSLSEAVIVRRPRRVSDAGVVGTARCGSVLSRPSQVAFLRLMDASCGVSSVSQSLSRV